jgi:hypothetical protein
MMDEIERLSVTSSGDIEPSFFWYKKGTSIKHNPSGPAIEWYNGNKEYWLNGELHRLDGPAFIRAKELENYKNTYWFINGFDVTYEIQVWAKERDIDLNNLSDMDKAVIALEWSNYSR